MRKRPFLIALSAGLIAVGFLPRAVACDGIAIKYNYQLFHAASAVYEGDALSQRFDFNVTQTWWGKPRDRVQLTWAADQATDPCSDQPSVVAGRHYLLVLYCQDGEATDNQVINCRSAVEDFDPNGTRFAALESPIWVGPSQVEAHLQQWLSGSLTDDAFLHWVSRMLGLALVEDEDWITVAQPDGRSFTSSRTGGTLQLLEELLGSTCTEDQTIDREAVANELVPSLHLLLFGNISNDPQTISKLDDLQFNLESLCSPARGSGTVPNESLQRTPTAAAPHPPAQAAVWVR